MKKIIILCISTLTIILSGCGGASPEPIKVMPSVRDSQNGNEWVRVSANIGTGNLQNAELENTAILLYEAASQYKKNGLEYFYIGNQRKRQLISIINNFKDLERYCFPKVEGFTSLEDKCSLSAGNDIVKLWFIGTKEPVISEGRFYWSVNQVLKDPMIAKYRNSALKDFDNKTITYESVKRIRHLK